MTESDSSIMTTDKDIDISNDVMTDNSTDIMTGNSQPLTRTIGKPKQDKDPNALKIASFRTKEGVWAEFSTKAESDGLTATDVLKAAMEQYITGEYNPRVITTISTPVRHTNNGLTRNDVMEIVNTAIGTAISTEQISSSVMTTVSTPSLSEDDVSMLISTKLVSVRSELAILQELNKKTLLELSYQRDEIEALKKSDAIG